MQKLSLGLVSRSRKENERRLAIHPRHLERLDPGLRGRVFLEQGYGEGFGMSDEQLRPFVGGIRTRQQLVDECDIITLPKPLAADVSELREGQVLWGWPHCVQDSEITQLAIDKRLTLIAFEAMNHWNSDGTFNLHVLHKNNEIAGYASVLHALSLVGSTGNYGRRLNAVVIGFGATARGAVTALSALGLNQVDILTQREVTKVASPIHSANIVTFDQPEDLRRSVASTENGPVPLARYLAEHDIIVNCVLQDPNAPMVFLDEEDLSTLAPGTLVIDVSCDEAMGFSWATPTTFADPMFTVGDHVHYYAVDHSPSYLWDSATWEISEALLPHLATVLSGAAAWESDETIRRAIEIRDGVINNPAILAFQSRDGDYPHARTR
ncbi:N(5)-(carboxyethyl)ornithine synthase [Pedococcus sp. KACC 23699]|uniref:N(5)-(Carboxyethyl)ornithine synthase n=1 Tax=Pedococcus sp. KACC 23699 TaxID=3149228 RepID=A0AAU7JWP2_9MICO